MSVAGKPTHKLSFEEVPSENGSVPDVKKGTDADAADMSRMGKKQVLRVRSWILSRRPRDSLLTEIDRESSALSPLSVLFVFSSRHGRVLSYLTASH
jgi:hypothetical protein